MLNIMEGCQSTLVIKRRLQLAGHCFRASVSQYHPASDLVFWQSHERFRVGQGNSLTYNRMLRRDTRLELDQLRKVETSGEPCAIGLYDSDRTFSIKSPT